MTKRFFYYLRIGLILFFCLGCLLGCASVNSKEAESSKMLPLNWQPLVEVAPNWGRELLREYTNLAPTAIAEMKIATAGSWQVVDFNFHELCGSLGCLYAVAHDGEMVKIDYIKPYTVKGKNLWASDGENLQLRRQTSDRASTLQTFVYDSFRGVILREQTEGEQIL